MSSGDATIAALRQQLRSLDAQRASIEAQLAALLEDSPKDRGPACSTAGDTALSDSEKIALFRRLFAGREDVFNGVPEQILCDNPKTVVIERNAYGEGKHRFNPYLLDLAKHYGIGLKLCAPYRAQTKGNVERFHRYLRGSFFNPLQAGQREPVDVVQANHEVRPWLHEVANVRVHATLKERPVDRFALERATLRALPLPYAGRRDDGPGDKRFIVPTPIESLQHPLATYDALAAELNHA